MRFLVNECRPNVSDVLGQPVWREAQWHSDSTARIHDAGRQSDCPSPSTERRPGTSAVATRYTRTRAESRMSVTSKVKQATEAVARVLAPDEKGENDIDILDTLEKEHDELKILLADLQDEEGASERLALVRKIKLLLLPHMEAEEKVVYRA